jgi:hypothetical protein
MNKSILTVLMLMLTLMAKCQTKENKPKFNLDFEQIDNNFPIGWENFGSSGYAIYLDSANVQNGKYSAVIEFGGNAPDFKAWAYTLPSNYDGKNIRRRKKRRGNDIISAI